MSKKQAKYVAIKLLESLHPKSNFLGKMPREQSNEYVKKMIEAVAELERNGVIVFPIDDRFY